MHVKTAALEKLRNSTDHLDDLHWNRRIPQQLDLITLARKERNENPVSQLCRRKLKYGDIAPAPESSPGYSPTHR